MKKFYLILVWIVSLVGFGQQSADVKADSTNIIKVRYVYHKPGVDYEKEMYLLVDEHKSQFFFKTEKETRKVKFYTAYIYDENFVHTLFFKDFSNTEYRVLESGQVLRADWENNFNWKITDETKIIKGYTVYKAFLEKDITNRKLVGSDSEIGSGKVIAWFTKDLPIPSGPDRYGGLPGLILELEYENFGETYLFAGLEMNPKESFFEPKNYIEVKRDTVFRPEKYKKIIKNLTKE